MSEEIHSTQTPADKPQADNWFVDGLKKQTVAILVAAIWAFYTFIWTSHDSDKDLKYKVDTNTKAIDGLVLADKQQTDAQNQIVIALTKVSEAQNRLASDVRDIQQQQQRNTEMLINRK